MSKQRQKAIDKLFGTFAITVMGAMLLGALYSFTLGISWQFHASQTASLSQMDAAIAIYQLEYDKVSDTIANVSEGDAVFRLNADTPVASLVSAQVQIAKELVDIKIHRLEYIAKISSRCRGPWAPTVWFFDDVSCATYKAM